MMSDRRIFSILFGICFYSSVFSDIAVAVCPTSGTLNGPTTTVDDTSCTELVESPTFIPATIVWNAGSNSDVQFDFIFVNNLLVTVISFENGAVVSGQFDTYNILLADIDITTQLLACEGTGINCINGATTVTISKGLNIKLTCVGSTQVCFDPPLTNTGRTTNITLTLDLSACIGLTGCP